MSDTNNPGDKTQARPPSKPLSLKRPIEQGTVRQSFSHGRTKQVVVETVKRRVIGAAPAAPVRETTPVAPATRVAGATGVVSRAGAAGAAPMTRRFTVSTTTCLERPWEKL